MVDGRLCVNRAMKLSSRSVSKLRSCLWVSRTDLSPEALVLEGGILDRARDWTLSLGIVSTDVTSLSVSTVRLVDF